MAIEYHEIECEWHDTLIGYDMDVDTRKSTLINYWVRNVDKDCKECVKIVKLYVTLKMGP